MSTSSPPDNDSYLRGAPAGFGQAISLAYKNMFNYNGRASLSAYWWTALYCLAVYMAGAILISLFPNALAGAGIIVAVLVLVAWLHVVLLGLSLAIRRMHDSGNSGWFIIVPIMNIVFSFMPGTPGPNRFG